MTQDNYTGVQGAVTYASAPFAVADFEFTVTRGVASHPRSGKWSDLNKPGKISVAGKITRIQTNADLLMAALNATPATGSATACLSATSFTAGTAVPITSDPATVSRLKVTTSNATTTLAGGFTIVGTDANDNYVSETIYIPASTLSGTVFYTSKAFKTANYAVTDVITGSHKLQIDGVLGDASVNVGEPKSFDLIGAVTDGTNHITVTLSNCFFTSAGFKFSDANTMLSDELAFMVMDPDADVIVTGADT